MLQLDISEVVALTREATRSLEDRQPRQFHRIIERAASTERRTHPWRNRTYHLEQSTFATELQKTSDGYEVELGARTFYASFVDNRGFMRLPQLAERAALEIDYYLDGEAERLGAFRI